MARPRKPRLIDGQPEVTMFKPQGVPLSGLRGVTLPVEGLEALRLVDAEGVDRAEAAVCLGVSQPTLCRILAEARRIVATALSQGMAIRVEGGSYAVRPDESREGGGGVRGEAQGESQSESTDISSATLPGRRACRRRGRRCGQGPVWSQEQNDKE